MKIVFSSASGADIRRLAEFLREQDEGLALRAVDRIVEAARSLDRFPERAAPLGRPGLRRLSVAFGDAACLLDYLIDSARGTVTILRVRHSREAR